MTTAELAAYLRVPVGTLRFWRHQGTGPKGFRMGGKKVMYKASDVRAWLEAQYNAEPGHRAS